MHLRYIETIPASGISIQLTRTEQNRDICRYVSMLYVEQSSKRDGGPDGLTGSSLVKRGKRTRARRRGKRWRRQSGAFSPGVLSTNGPEKRTVKLILNNSRSAKLVTIIARCLV